jgi:hypothetical protein
MIDGTLTITRQARLSLASLGDDAVRGLKLMPDSSNTMLLYDNDDIGVQFLYPRRWRVAGVENRQVRIDADAGNGLLLTILAPKDVPSPAQYARESQEYIAGQEGKILGSQPARRVQANPDVDFFGFEAEMKGQRIELDYYIARQRFGGATLAARLVPESLRELRPDVERIARSLVVTK